MRNLLTPLAELTHYEISSSAQRQAYVNAPVAQQVYSDKVLAMLACYEGARLPQHIVDKWTGIADDAARKGDRKTNDDYRRWLAMAGFR